MSLNILQALHSLLGQHDQVAKPGPIRPLYTNPESVGTAHSPAQALVAAHLALPQGYISPATGASANPYGGIVNPNSFLINLANQSGTQRYGQIINSMPATGNFRGALPPKMVNVPWSSEQVPYTQSLHPPKGY